MLNRLICIFSIVILFGAYVLAQEKPASVDQESKSWNTVCPVEGNKVNPEIKTFTYNDKVYGFCSNVCATAFNEDPAYHSAQLNEDGTKYKVRKKDKRTDSY